ncbi:MAG TPA: HAMP domain-containing sensor histidine kinase [Bryobacteraceae bacterium]|nr:HAMP domain-containing sensor histidine kinase [Bryobacteraceae bacterium]
MVDTKLSLEGLVHDLNNIFQTLGEGAELLQSDPRWAKLALTMQRSVARGERIVRSIVESNRSGSELAPIVEGSIQFTKDYLECVHGPQLDFTHEIEMAFRVKGDPASWERVLVNLFVNSAEAGARLVRIQGGQGKIVVSDDGPGIAEELLPRIFQAHVSTKSIVSGLGLYVVQSIVEQNGATVTASNREGGGAIFEILAAS